MTARLKQEGRKNEDQAMRIASNRYCPLCKHYNEADRSVNFHHRPAECPKVLPGTTYTAQYNAVQTAKRNNACRQQQIVEMKDKRRLEENIAFTETTTVTEATKPEVRIPEKTLMDASYKRKISARVVDFWMSQNHNYERVGNEEDQLWHVGNQWLFIHETLPKVSLEMLSSAWGRVQTISLAMRDQEAQDRRDLIRKYAEEQKIG